MEFRHEIIRLHENEKLSERQIAQRLGIYPSTVHYWLAKEFKEPVLPRKRGRPRVTDKTIDTILYNTSLENPFMTAVDLRLELAPQISVDTVRKRLKEQGLKCCIPARKPFLKPIHIQKRLEFAINHIGWGVSDWKKVVFCDEKIFRSYSKGNFRVYRPRESNRFDSKYLASSENPHGRFGINVWMAFGENIRIIHRIQRKTLNAEYYTDFILPLVEEELFENDLIFMQDLASIHTSKLTKHWLETHNINVMDDWPPKGPDMNPVENVWAELVRRTRDDNVNRDRLWENIYQAFCELDDEYFTNLINSMPRRIADVLQKRGGWTKY